MLTKEENDLLTRVEGDAPMGAIMRHHWLPICLSEQVAEPDCDPVKERILGEVENHRHRASFDAWIIQETYRRTRQPAAA